MGILLLIELGTWRARAGTRDEHVLRNQIFHQLHMGEVKMSCWVSFISILFEYFDSLFKCFQTKRATTKFDGNRRALHRWMTTSYTVECYWYLSWTHLFLVGKWWWPTNLHFWDCKLCFSISMQINPLAPSIFDPFIPAGAIMASLRRERLDLEMLGCERLCLSCSMTAFITAYLPKNLAFCNIAILLVGKGIYCCILVHLHVYTLWKYEYTIYVCICSRI